MSVDNIGILKKVIERYLIYTLLKDANTDENSRKIIYSIELLGG